MTQEYKNPKSVAWMAQDLCPECGGKPDGHAPFREFWLRPPGCDLLPAGVTERIEHFKAKLITLEEAAEALGIDLSELEIPNLASFQPKKKFRPLRVNGEPIPQHILDGPPGEFARYCGETDPTVLGFLDAED